MSDAQRASLEWEKWMREHVRSIFGTRAAYIEVMAGAFLKETNLSPQEAELCEVWESNSNRWFFRKREPFPMEAELQAARRVVEAVREWDTWRHDPATSTQRVLDLAEVVSKALAAYDALKGEG